MRIIREKTVYQLTFLPRFFPVNCYFVEEDDGLTLVGAALFYSSKGILHAAGKIGKPITRILLTHAHEDHVGALDGLKQVLPDVPVHISNRDARLLAGDRSLDPNEPNTPIRGGVPKKLKTRADVLLQEGNRIGSLLAVAAPGHTQVRWRFSIRAITPCLQVMLFKQEAVWQYPDNFGCGFHSPPWPLGISKLRWRVHENCGNTVLHYLPSVMDECCNNLCLLSNVP